MRGQRVSQRPGNQKWERRQREQGQLRVKIKHDSDDNEHLQDRDHALLDAVDQDALDRVHVFQNTRHQIARGAIVEPTQRQQLDVGVKIAAQIENNFLFESVVQQNPQRVERVLKNKRQRREQDQRQQFLRMMQTHHVIDDSLRHRGKNDHHQCTNDRAAQRSGRQPRITLQISKNAPNRFHFRAINLDARDIASR